MAYDSPKAAHFSATDNTGEPLPDDVTGQARWIVAGRIELEFPCLLNLTESDIARIQDLCAKYSSDTVTIEFVVPKRDF